MLSFWLAYNYETFEHAPIFVVILYVERVILDLDDLQERVGQLEQNAVRLEQLDRAAMAVFEEPTGPYATLDP